MTEQKQPYKEYIGRCFLPMALNILILPVIFLAWVVIVNIVKAIINYLEFRPNVEKSYIIAKIKDYRWATGSKPVIIAETMTKNELTLTDYKKKFNLICNSYMGKIVKIKFYNHCTGILLLHIDTYIYDIQLYYPETPK